MNALGIRSLLETVEAEQDRTDRQIAPLEAIVAGIVEASELVSTDDEHDPEGATIAYERAQASARSTELMCSSCVPFTKGRNTTFDATSSRTG